MSGTNSAWLSCGFNSQPPEGGWRITAAGRHLHVPFQLTAARRRLGNRPSSPPWHSRFNSQPPEGGWLNHMARALKLTGFNSQPPEGGWCYSRYRLRLDWTFQLTAARRRLVALRRPEMYHQVGFNSQPPEGGWV